MSSLLSVTNAEEVPVREVEDDGLVYTWPLNLSAYQREIGERSPADATECADESVASAVLYGASPTVSESTGGSSPMVATPAQCHNGAYVHYESPQESEGWSLEKITRLNKLRCKAPPPLCLGGINGADGEIGCIRDGERTAHETQMLRPLTAAIEITDLSVRTFPNVLAWNARPSGTNGLSMWLGHTPVTNTRVPKPDEALEGLTRSYMVPLDLTNIGRPTIPCEEAALHWMALRDSASDGSRGTGV
ncbi:hypothetical protein AZE42_10536 [Rhizopogon vesiculosus]|uniref:Uncharacterized protein n=1 Tax=Rhizopogon vesiculosus TaxID=180088 RepID=A0A1J8QHG6_9AGAM|nr:hypothetical protein AZE42_10536 [Rhizopogon vesiculosus]